MSDYYNGEETEVPHVDKPYRASAKDAPGGPRDNEEELKQIQDRTAEFAGHDEARAKEEEAESAQDPFSPELAPAFTLITLMRIYDVQLALLREQNQDVADALMDVHSSGKLLASFPWLEAGTS